MKRVDLGIDAVLRIDSQAEYAQLRVHELATIPTPMPGAHRLHY